MDKITVYTDGSAMSNGRPAMKKNRDLWRKLMMERQKFTSIRFI